MTLSRKKHIHAVLTPVAADSSEGGLWECVGDARRGLLRDQRALQGALSPGSWEVASGKEGYSGRSL